MNLNIFQEPLTPLLPPKSTTAFIYSRYNSNCPLLTSVFPQANPGVVTCLENTLHGLETGDQVTFSEVVGMSAINGTTHTVEGKRSALRSSYNMK